MTVQEPGETRPRILVAAVGNPDRGDDGVGPLVARKLVGRLPPEAKLVVRSGDMMSLIEDWSGCDALICVDAAAARDTPGRIHRVDLATETLPPDLSFTSSHAFGVAEAIELARVLDMAPKKIVIYAVEGCCFDAGAPFTSAVASAASEVADCVAAEVYRALSSPPSDHPKNRLSI